jgi:hypothetical protein
VQILCPVEDRALTARLEEILAVNLSDDLGAPSTHEEFQRLARQRQG